ncbi:FAD-dependent monooxygenase OpS4 [Colletotrichum sp. SAR 10_96]|nr:FAD-dependent monooxygenase OpS4 [Colletotrichum sp. SAR 10_96]
MKIIIVGAGLGGFCAALGFARKGHHVRVLEQRPDLSPAGGALNIRPGASKILHSWGLGPDLRRVSADTPANVFRNLATGEVATRAIATDISEYPDWGTSRSVLIEIFHQKAKDAGAVITFNAPVTNVEDDAHAAYVTLSSGERLEADLVLAADGIRSLIRDRILRETGQLIDPIITDVTLYGHAMQPSAAQGFSLIVEDIGVLEHLISQASDPSANVKTITSFWQEIRKARSGEWQVKSLKNTKPDMNAEFSSGPFLKWAQGTDAIAEAEKYLKGSRSRL